MATEAEHRKQADHNQACLDSIDKTRFPDWAATVAFYKAVHLVEMLLAKRNLGYRGGSHTRRNNILKKDYPAVWRDYRPLYAFSRVARYWCLKVKPDDYSYIARRLDRVERTVESLM